jgi:subtilisin family serine protease
MEDLRTAVNPPLVQHNGEMALPGELERWLLEASRLLTAHTGDDRHGELIALCRAVRSSMHAASVSIAELDGDELHYLAAEGDASSGIVGERLSTSRGVAGYVARSGGSLAVDRVQDDQRFARDLAERSGYFPTSILAVPIVDDGERVVGVLSVLDRVDVEGRAYVPAWSEPFHQPGGPGPAPSLGSGSAVNREWAYGDGRGAGVTVAIVDSGIDGSHPLVGGVSRYVSVERDDSTVTGVRFVEGQHDDLYGHGTACAAIVRRVAPAVELVSVRVLGADLKGSAGAFAHGVDWCLDHGIDVINLSMSTASERWAETFWELVDVATQRRVMLVAAMNNERRRTIPSEFSGVFSVACAPSTDHEGVWCNPAGPADWAAVGVDVDVAWLGGSTIRATGNSFAAPVVAGHLARVMATHPGITAWQAKSVLAELSVNAPRSGS